ncbi:MAG: hypothetical protein U0326_42445 [Polyangiales bacterium]
MSKNPKDNAPNTLRDEDIVSQPDTGRRSVMAVVGATVLGAASKALGGCVVQSPQPAPVGQVTTGGTVVVQQGRTGVTDNDQGQWADPVGNGRGGYRGVVTGITDGDSGTYSDPVNQGRGHWGRGAASGLTDGDSGSWSDPVGNGRGTARFSNTGITDGDSGSWADPVGGGRGHR